MNIKKYVKNKSFFIPCHLKKWEEEAIEELFEDCCWYPQSINVLGNIREMDRNSVAVVGSRRISDYGRRACEYVVGDLAAAGVTIVSGLMYGVDIWAHRSALAVGGRTIAVLGYGFDYLKTNPYTKEVVDKILNEDKGLIISEYENDQPPNKWTFPKRNRIISAISKCTVVIEAGEQSGSIITANHALEFSKDIYAVPGRIFFENSAGCNHLIKDGAFLLDNPSQILEKMFPNRKFDTNDKSKQNFESRLKQLIKIHKLSEEEQKVLYYIGNLDESVTLEDLISAKIVSDNNSLNSIITKLEIYSLLKKDFSGRLILLV